MRYINRRDFIKFSGLLIGGTILTGCNIFDGNNDNTIPNGYKFYKIKSIDDNVGDRNEEFSIAKFGASVHISSNNIVTFDAYDSENKHGLFQLHIDFSNNKPSIIKEHTNILSDDILNDGRNVRDFSSHDVDDSGNILATIQSKNTTSEQHYGDGLYLDIAQNGFETILTCKDELEQYSEFNGIIGDVAISEENGIIAVVSHTATNRQGVSGESIIHLPTYELNSLSTLMTTNDYVNGTDYKIAGFGIVDLKGDSLFAVSAHLTLPENLLASADELQAMSQHCILSAYTWSPNDHQLFATPQETMLSSTHTGKLSYGPRVTNDGQICTKIGGLDGDNEILVYGDKVIRRTDEVMPTGEEIASFTPGSVAPDGTLFYTQYIVKSDDIVYTSLVAYDGNAHSILLDTGDTLSDGGEAVNHIVFSTTTNHVNEDNKIVMLCEFSDETQSIVIGIPV
jgi:hypothetical protein